MAKKKTKESITDITERIDTDKPKKNDLLALEKFLDETPNYVDFVGNRQNQLLHQMLEKDFKDSVLVRKTTEKFIEKMKSEMGYATSTFIEKMLIEEIIMRWLRLQMVEGLHYQNTSKIHPSETGYYWDRRLTQAQNRYLKAINTLTKVRKMIAQTQAKGVKIFKDLLDNK
jgi:hypothetical protein